MTDEEIIYNATQYLKCIINPCGESECSKCENNFSDEFEIEDFISLALSKIDILNTAEATIKSLFYPVGGHEEYNRALTDVLMIFKSKEVDYVNERYTKIPTEGSESNESIPDRG